MAKKSKGKKRKAGKKGPIAERVDRYELYQQAVQSPETDIRFYDRVFKKEYGRLPVSLREDFCGTAAISCAWVESRKGRVAYGYDLDPEPLEWGRAHNVASLPKGRREQVHLIEADVREVSKPQVDVLCAQNFSFFTFRTRDELRGYFESARRNLRREGVFVLDMMGGAECFEEEHEDQRSVNGFDYIWEHKRFDPISHECAFAIHFLFKDGSAMHHAFDYEWRLWTLPEVRELLSEAGFKRVDVYWEGTDHETGEGNGVFRKAKSAPADPAWIACLAAIP